VPPLDANHLLTLRDLNPDGVRSVLDRARELRAVSPDAAQPARASAAPPAVVTYFAEPSTRTRLSFELAARLLGFDVAHLDAGSSSAAKGESLEDTARTIEALRPRAIVIRHGLAGAPGLVARHTRAAVINAGDGSHAHPTQALLDALTIADRFGSLDALEGMPVAIVGDVLHSRVARSLLGLLTMFGAAPRLVGPRAFVPTTLSSLASSIHHDLDEGLAGVQIVYLLRIQLERHAQPAYPSNAEFRRHFGLTRERLDRLAPHAVVMHPGPVNRGVELAPDLLDDERCLVHDQVAAGLWVRAACLDLLRRRD
jgi:aspartate carbamoyltransferase catalytic subunit